MFIVARCLHPLVGLAARGPVSSSQSGLWLPSPAGQEGPHGISHPSGPYSQSHLDVLGKSPENLCQGPQDLLLKAATPALHLGKAPPLTPAEFTPSSRGSPLPFKESPCPAPDLSSSGCLHPGCRRELVPQWMMGRTVRDKASFRIPHSHGLSCHCWVLDGRSCEEGGW